ENAKLLDETINNKLQFEKSSNEVYVDFVIDKKSLSKSLVEEVAQLNKHFGKDCEEPLFTIKNIEIDCTEINFGSTMKFTINGIEILSFSVDDRLEKLASEGKLAVLDIIGTLGINRFLSKETHQVKIEMIDIK